MNEKNKTGIPEVINNQQTHQFEIRIEDKVAFIPYSLKEDMIALLHTEVPEELGGRGIGTKLALYALNYAKEHHLKIDLYCPFITKYVDGHPEWKEYVKHYRVRYR